MHIFESLQTQIIENRTAARLVVDTHGLMCGAQVQVRNVSVSGAQLECSASVYAGLEAMLGKTAVPVELQLHETVKVEATVVYANAQEQRCVLGVHFTQPLPHATLDSYARTLN